MNSPLARPDGFEGPIPMFPLPNVVLFPNLMLPLHIFEDRYRQMIRDALEGNRLIAMALLREGWEEDYEGRPPVHDVVCVGRIIQDEELPDGRFNILLEGLFRGRLRKEQDPVPGRAYRSVILDPLEDYSDDLEAEAREGWREAVMELLRSILPQSQIPNDAPLGSCVDLLAVVALSDPKQQQAILETGSVAQRLKILWGFLGGAQSLDRLAYGRPRSPDTPPPLN